MQRQDTEVGSVVKHAKGFELERIVSCRSGHHWWRTKLDVDSGEPLDDLHWSSTLGAAIKTIRELTPMIDTAFADKPPQSSLRFRVVRVAANLTFR